MHFVPSLSLILKSPFSYCLFLIGLNEKIAALRAAISSPNSPLSSLGDCFLLAIALEEFGREGATSEGIPGRGKSK